MATLDLAFCVEGTGEVNREVEVLRTFLADLYDYN